MIDPIVVKVEPPIATTLGECKMMDIVERNGRVGLIVERVAVFNDTVVMTQNGRRWHIDSRDEVRIVARLQLGGAA